MGKALMGTYAAPRSLELLEEVRALRSRISQLETALADAEAALATRDDLEHLDVLDAGVSVTA